MHKTCAHHLHMRSNMRQFKKKTKQNKKNNQHDYLITVWLDSPWINIRAEKQTVIETELIKVLLVKPEEKIKALGVFWLPVTVCSFISSDLSLRCSFKGWWYLHTTEEGPGVSRSEGGPQQSKCHFILFILLSLLLLSTAILFSCCSVQHLPPRFLFSLLSFLCSLPRFFCCFLLMESTCLQS